MEERGSSHESHAAKMQSRQPPARNGCATISNGETAKTRRFFGGGGNSSQRPSRISDLRLGFLSSVTFFYLRSRDRRDFSIFGPFFYLRSHFGHLGFTLHPRWLSSVHGRSAEVCVSVHSVTPPSYRSGLLKEGLGRRPGQDTQVTSEQIT